MPGTQTLADLERFAIARKVKFETGPNGLVRAAVTTAHASATVYLYGAHVNHYQPAGQKPLLFLSKNAVFEPGKAIRGGVPVCFPWFGPRSGDATSPMHGFARTAVWSLESVKENPDGAVALTFLLEPDEAMLKTWPFTFALRHRVTVGQSLEMVLETTNAHPQPFRFETAQHTYLAVSDVRNVTITGLGGNIYIDKADAMKHKQQNTEGVRLTAETDRIYTNVTKGCTVDDPRGERRIIIEKSGSETTVLWNPWDEKAKTLSDLAPEEWHSFLCIETANASPNAILLRPNQKHQMRTNLVSKRYEQIF